MPGNAQPEVLFRRIGMYLAKHVGGWTTVRIGQVYNGRDHSTVCYSIQRIEALRKADPEIDELLQSLTAACEQEDVSNLEDRAAAPRQTLKNAVLPRINGDLVDDIAERIADRVALRLNWLRTLAPRPRTDA